MHPSLRERPDAAPYRPIPLGPRSVQAEARPDGSILVRSTEALAPYPRKLTDRLEQVARQFPDRVFLAVRAEGQPRRWRELRYGEAWNSVQAIAQGLLDRG